MKTADQGWSTNALRKKADWTAPSCFSSSRLAPLASLWDAIWSKSLLRSTRGPAGERKVDGRSSSRAAQNCATLCQVGVLSPAGRSNSASWKPTATIPPVRPISWPPKRACCVRALAIASRMRGSLTGLAAPFMQALACSDTCGPAASACMESAAATRNSAIDLILWSCANALASDPHRDSVARWRVRCVEHFSRADFKLADILLQSAIPFILMRCEDIAANTDFRHLSTIRDIVVDLRYASVDNFVGRDLYGSLDCAWLHHLAAAGLERAVALLDREAAGHRLLVL